MSETKSSLVNQKSDDDIPFGTAKNPETTPSFRAKEAIDAPPAAARNTSQAGIFRREIYLAILRGFAARGELSRRTPGTQLGVTTDADVQNICRHAAGVAAFAASAAKDAGL